MNPSVKFCVSISTVTFIPPLVGEGATVTEGDGVIVIVGVGVTVTEGDGVVVGDGVIVGAGVMVGVTVPVGGGVMVIVGVGVAVVVGVGVTVIVGTGVTVAVGDGVIVMLGVGEGMDTSDGTRTVSIPWTTPLDAVRSGITMVAPLTMIEPLLSVIWSISPSRVVIMVKALSVEVAYA